MIMIVLCIFPKKVVGTTCPKHFPKIHGSNLMDSKENPSEEAEKERERGEGGRRNKNKKNATIQELNTPIYTLRPKGETNFLRAIFRNWKNRASPNGLSNRNPSQKLYCHQRSGKDDLQCVTSTLWDIINWLIMHVLGIHQFLVWNQVHPLLLHPRQNEKQYMNWLRKLYWISLV